MTVTEAIQKRRSVHSYDTGRDVTAAQLRKLIDTAALAPSSFNLNQWRFIAVRAPERRQRLMEISLNQKHVGEAPVTLIVLGKIDAHTDVDRFADDWIAKGYYPDDRHLRFVSDEFYGKNPAIQRDEAIRSTSIMAGFFMLAAVETGLSTAAVIGFRPDELVQEFNIPDNYVPVMLLTVGYEKERMPERVKRLAFDEITFGDTFGQPFDGGEIA